MTSSTPHWSVAPCGLGRAPAGAGAALVVGDPAATVEFDGATLLEQFFEVAAGVSVKALGPLGIEPTLETRELDLAAFEAAPIESNRIWIADRPLEAWIGADVGGTQCCSVCGDNDCRTLEFDGHTFEAVPERLIVKAGLAAAASLLHA